MADRVIESVQGPIEQTIDAAPALLQRWPTVDELPCSDGVPMETHFHVLEFLLLLDALGFHWRRRNDVFIGGNQFLYYSPDQVRNREFIGPDHYVVLNTSTYSRKSWVIWEEGKPPEVVIELLSESNPDRDKVEKKPIYQDKVKAPAYYWFSPITGEWAGFELIDGVYVPIEPAEDGRLPCRILGLSLMRWRGVYRGERRLWMRWADADGRMLPTAQEAAEAQEARAAEEARIAEQERLRADEERDRAEKERDRAEKERDRAEKERDRAEKERERAGRLIAKLKELGIDAED